MAGPDPIVFLRVLVEAHDVPHPSRGVRTPIYLFVAHNELNHHALPDPAPDVDEAMVNDLYSAGFIDLDYSSSGHDMKLTPTQAGRALLEAHERVSATEPVADVRPILDAICAQAESSNPLAWPAVRPVLAALRTYWERGGFAPHGVQLQPLFRHVPEEHAGLFIATVAALVEGDYLAAPSDLLSFGDLPAEVAFTDRARTVLDGWPGAAPDELFENLVAVLGAAIQRESEPARRRRLEKMLETVREVGASTAGEVLARVLMGGS